MDNQVLEKLNYLVGFYWTFYSQHKAHLALIQSWGYEKLAKTMEEHISDEPETIDKLQSRILDLGGEINFKLGEIKIGKSVEDIFKIDLIPSAQVREFFYEIIEIMRQNHDLTTSKMLEEVLVDEEEHALWIEQELELLNKLGEQLYLAKRI